MDLQATYSILNLSLSDLIKEILEELKKGFIPILELRVLLQSLNFVPFTDEGKGQEVLGDLTECLRNQSYLNQSRWKISNMRKMIVNLQKLILWDYKIDGSLIMYCDDEIIWDMDVTFVLNEGSVEFYSMA